MGVGRSKQTDPLNRLISLGGPKPTLQMIRDALSLGANPNLRDTGGMTPLIKAVILDYDDIVRVLIEEGNAHLQMR